MVSRNKWRRLCVFAPLRATGFLNSVGDSRKGAKTHRTLRRNATLWRHFILMTLTDFVVDARVKGNARQMSDKLKPESTDRRVMKGKDRLGDGSANCQFAPLDQRPFGQAQALSCVASAPINVR